MYLIKKSLLPFISNRLNTAILSHHSPTTVIFPFYHTVSDDYLPHIAPIYRPKTIKEFQQDLDYLLKYFEPVSMEEVYAHTRKEKMISRPSFHLSFDDGLREVYDIALPILLKKGIPFTVFINSAFVDNRDLFFRYKAALIGSNHLSINYQQREKLDQIATEAGLDFHGFLKKQRPYLSTTELREMKGKGITIGAHSIDHPLYTEISEDEQVWQTLESCAFVKEKFGEKHVFFAFPFSDADIPETFFSRIYPDVDLTFGISGITVRQEGRHLGRIDMEKYEQTTRGRLNSALLISNIKNNRIWN